MFFQKYRSIPSERSACSFKFSSLQYSDEKYRDNAMPHSLSVGIGF
jgi:hypothetical protein